MSGRSTLDNVYRMLRDRKFNVYTDVAKEVADELEVKSNPITAGHNDARDAFRHGYTSGIVAHRFNEGISAFSGNLNEFKNHVPSPKDVMVDIGGRYAKVVAAAAGKTPMFKESSPRERLKPEEEWMDYYNNQKGLEIARQVKVRGGE